MKLCLCRSLAISIVNANIFNDYVSILCVVYSRFGEQQWISIWQEESKLVHGICVPHSMTKTKLKILKMRNAVLTFDLSIGWVVCWSVPNAPWSRCRFFQNFHSIYLRILPNKLQWYLTHLHRFCIAVEIFLSNFLHCTSWYSECERTFSHIKLFIRFFYHIWTVRKWTPFPIFGPGHFEIHSFRTSEHFSLCTW